MVGVIMTFTVEVFKILKLHFGIFLSKTNIKIQIFECFRVILVFESSKKCPNSGFWIGSKTGSRTQKKRVKKGHLDVEEGCLQKWQFSEIFFICNIFQKYFGQLTVSEKYFDFLHFLEIIYKNDSFWKHLLLQIW